MTRCMGRYLEEVDRVTIRDLRNRSADVLARVAQGESLTVTKDGAPDGAPVGAGQAGRRFEFRLLVGGFGMLRSY